MKSMSVYQSMYASLTELSMIVIGVRAPFILTAFFEVSLEDDYLLSVAITMLI